MKYSDFMLLAMIPTVTLSQMVAAKDYLTIEEAQGILFPAASHFEAGVLNFSDDDRDAIKDASGNRQRWDSQKVWAAKAGDKTLGWVFLDDVVGKHEFITYATAIDTDGKVLGIEILTYRETHGDEVINASWRQNFIGKTKDDRFKLNKDIPNISGATLSCRNLTDGVHRLLTIADLFLKHG